MRIIVTVVLTIALLLVGGLSLASYSIDKVVLNASYFETDLLYAGAYSTAYTLVLGMFTIPELSDAPEIQTDMSGTIALEILRSINPNVFSSIASDYVGKWMSYLLAEVEKDEIPMLSIGEYKDSIYASAIVAAEDEEFLLSLLSLLLQAEGDAIDNYTIDEQKGMLELYDIKATYVTSVDAVLTDESSFFYQTAVSENPLTVLSYLSPASTDEQLRTIVESYYGKVAYYKAIIHLVFAGILACIALLFIIWVTKLRVPFVISGAVIVASAIPVFLISSSSVNFNKVFTYLLNMKLLSENPFTSDINLYNNLAVMPIVNSMYISSAVALGIGLIFILLGIVVGRKKKDDTSPIPIIKVEKAKPQSIPRSAQENTPQSTPKNISTGAQ